MDQTLAVLAVVAFIGAWAYFIHRRSEARTWSPLWLAFGTTAAAALFILSGSTGYVLSKRTRFLAGTAWSDSVVWWEVVVGIGLVPLAFYFWRRGIQGMTGRPHA